MAMPAEAGGRRLTEEIVGHASAAEIEEYERIDILDARHSNADPFISDALVAAIALVAFFFILTVFCRLIAKLQLRVIRAASTCGEPGKRSIV